MTILILDTSQTTSYACLCHEQKIEEFFTFTSNQDLSSSLASHLQKLLNRPLSALALGIGPGSYTGTRVAATFAKSLSYALSLPLISYNSLLGFIPDSIESSFAFYYPTKSTSPYIFLGHKDPSCAIPFLSHTSSKDTLITLDSAKLIAQHPELASKTFVKGQLNPPLLAKHLHQKFLAQDWLTPDNIDRLALIYLQEHALKESYIL